MVLCLESTKYFAKYTQNTVLNNVLVLSYAQQSEMCMQIQATKEIKIKPSIS